MTLMPNGGYQPTIPVSGKPPGGSSPPVGTDPRDARIAELEAEVKSVRDTGQFDWDLLMKEAQALKTKWANEKQRAEQAEAEVAVRGRMLMTLFMEERDSMSERGKDFFMPSDLWLADLRARAEEPREPLPGEVDAYMAEEHAKARAEEGSV